MAEDFGNSSKLTSTLQKVDKVNEAVEKTNDANDALKKDNKSNDKDDTKTKNTPTNKEEKQGNKVIPRSCSEGCHGG